MSDLARTHSKQIDLHTKQNREIKEYQIKKCRFFYKKKIKLILLAKDSKFYSKNNSF